MFGRTLVWLLCYFSLFILPAAAQQRAIRPVDQIPSPSNKQALVIGNSAYEHTSPLRNPANDAKEIAKTLKRLGFEVKTLLDANQRQMEQAINNFGNNLRRKKGIGLFYYAGHGVQVQGENYLLPVDIIPQTAADVRYDAVPVGKLLGQMEEADNSMNLVILDACRNNPFPQSFRSANQGLAQVNAPTGSFISYATAPGQVAADGEGANGLFTSSLLKHMVVPNLKLEEVFKRVRIDVQQASNDRQVPWDSSSLTGDFYFVTPSQQLVSSSTAEPQLQENTEQQKTEIKWLNWQSQMQKDFDKVLKIETKDSGIGLKIESWKRFLQNWREENPLSSDDANLRSMANNRLQYWEREQSKVSELEQVESDLEEQAKQAKQRINPPNKDFPVIARFLSEDKSAEAGELLSKYDRGEKQSELRTFFAKQPAAIQYELAQVYRKGLNVEKNENIGLGWYKQAAEGNHPKAQTMLGYLYQMGKGVEKDLQLAIEWYERAAAQGEAMALFNLGSLYRKGYGVRENQAKARELYRQAAAKGNQPARQVLKRMAE